MLKNKNTSIWKLVFDYQLQKKCRRIYAINPRKQREREDIFNVENM